ncbi:MAG TPA: hypothetical protein VKL61_07980 [Candidatus Polarisedimenticolia bacterium]|nr:hypothetical protein [Candidatus Polarisedimenticolia bacterium]
MTPWRSKRLPRLIPALVLVLTALFAGAGESSAVSPVLWSQQSPADFEKGKPEGVAVTTRSGIILARAVHEIPVKTLEENSQPFLWSEALDSKGNLYVGSGNEGRVFKVPRSGGGSLFASTGDFAVQALAFDSKDNLFVGSSPNGKVYRVTPDGKSEVWFDPDERYIWALAVDRAGSLFVATGEHGIIYKVTDKDKASPFFDSEESHIVSLTFDRQGNLLAGSSGKGLLYRIGPDGRGTVLLDTAFKEVNSVALDSAGKVYASAIFLGQQALPEPLRRAKAPGPEGAGELISEAARMGAFPMEQGAGDMLSSEDRSEKPPAASGSGLRSQVFRIDLDGVATSVWSSEAETVFSLAVVGDGDLYLGTGDSGKVRHLEPDGSASLMAKLASSEVTALLAGTDGSLYAAGSNTGKVYRLDSDASESGTFVSAPRDASTVARWGHIGWRGSAPGGSRVELFTRSGNSAVPDSTWSDWSTAYLAPGGTGVASPSARFIQWKARLSRQGKGGSPFLQEVSLTYLPANLAPKVEKVRINPPGIILQKPLVVPAAEGPETAFSAAPHLPEGIEFPSPFPVVPGKKVYQRGMRSIAWESGDENSDALRFDLFYRGEDEKAWKPLSRGVKENYFAWDSTLFPDGRYRVRVVANDAPSNPSGTEKMGEEISAPFVVDNTPPRIDLGPPRKEERGYVAELKVSDSTSPIRSMEYSVDAAPWLLAIPVDGIADSLSEQYRVVLERLPAGEHVVLFKATDSEGNVGTEKLVITGG